MAGQTLVIIGGREFELRGLGRVVGLDPAREAGALHRFRAAIIERLDAEFPRAIVEHEQVPFLDIGGDEEVQRRSEEHTSELQALMRISYAVFCLNKKYTILHEPTLPTDPAVATVHRLHTQQHTLLQTE